MYKALSVAVLLLTTFTFAQDRKSAASKPATLTSPVIVASVSLVSQNAESAPFTLVTPSANALYRITGYMQVTETNDLGGAWCTVFKYADPVGPRMNSKLTVQTTLNNGVPTVNSAVIIAEVRAGAPLTYSISACAGGTQDTNVPFNLFFTVEQLQ